MKHKISFKYDNKLYELIIENHDQRIIEDIFYDNQFPLFAKKENKFELTQFIELLLNRFEFAAS